MYTLIREVQEELCNAFMIKHSNVANEMPFDKPSLLAFNNKFLYRLRQNKDDTPQRVLKDLVSFDNIGDFNIEEFVQLIKNSRNIDRAKMQNHNLEGMVKQLSDNIISRIHSESAFFSKLDDRILKPITHLDIIYAKRLCLILIMILNTLNGLIDSMKTNLVKELAKADPTILNE